MSVLSESASTHSLQTDRGPASSYASFDFNLTLGHLGVTCPDEPKLSFRGPRHMFFVAKSLEPSSQDIGEHARREGERLAIAMSASHQFGSAGSMRIRVADLRIVLYVPLILKVFRFIKADDVLTFMDSSDGSVLDGYGLQSDTFPVRAQAQRALPSGPVVIRNALLGANSMTIQLGHHGHANTHMGDVSSFYERLREHRKLVARHRAFDKICGDWPVPVDLEIDCVFGAIYVAQVSEFTAQSLLVEEYRVWPYHIQGYRGLKRAPPKKGADRKSRTTVKSGFSSKADATPDSKQVGCVK